MAKDKQPKAKEKVVTDNRTANSAVKQRRIERQAKLAARPDGEVSDNCLKKRQERRRNYTPELRREARIRGLRQFDPKPDPTIAIEVTTDKGE